MTATHVVVAAEAEELGEEAMEEGEGGGETDDRGQATVEVPVAQVRSVDSIVCTMHQIGEARRHALEHFPGAKYTKVKPVRKGGLGPAEAKEVAEFLRDKTVVEEVSMWVGGWRSEDGDNGVDLEADLCSPSLPSTLVRLRASFQVV